MLKTCRFLLIMVFIAAGVAAILALGQVIVFSGIVTKENSNYLFAFILLLYASWIIFNLSPLGDIFQDLTLNTRKPSTREMTKLNSIVDELNRRVEKNGMKTFPSPRLRMISDESPNAMAFGSHSIAMTTGLLKGEKNQARAVFAHELGHLVNKDTFYLSLKMSAIQPLIIIWDFLCVPILNFADGTMSIPKILLVIFLSPLFIVGFLGSLLIRASSFLEKLLSSTIEYKADHYAIMLTRDEGLPNFLDFIAPLDTPPANTFMASYTTSHPPTELRHGKVDKILQEMKN